mmetsp:Transcript_86285/g.229322  ORF Transcript_86285/g.229322 Transcript_86285/m.229322 type:complete len:420 (+) Transcript_86285:636-1895(+)
MLGPVAARTPAEPSGLQLLHTIREVERDKGAIESPSRKEVRGVHARHQEDTEHRHADVGEGRRNPDVAVPADDGLKRREAQAEDAGPHRGNCPEHGDRAAPAQAAQQQPEDGAQYPSESSYSHHSKDIEPGPVELASAGGQRHEPRPQQQPRRVWQLQPLLAVGGPDGLEARRCQRRAMSASEITTETGVGHKVKVLGYIQGSRLHVPHPVHQEQPAQQPHQVERHGELRCWRKTACCCHWWEDPRTEPVGHEAREAARQAVQAPVDGPGKVRVLRCAHHREDRQYHRHRGHGEGSEAQRPRHLALQPPGAQTIFRTCCRIDLIQPRAALMEQDAAVIPFGVLVAQLLAEAAVALNEHNRAPASLGLRRVRGVSRRPEPLRQQAEWHPQHLQTARHGQPSDYGISRGRPGGGPVVGWIV